MEVGAYLLYAALLFGLADVISNFWSGKIKEKYSLYLSLITAGLVTATIVSLAYYFVTDSFSIKYVYEYGEKGLELPYKLSAVWAGQAGSLLLWTFLLYTLYVILRLSSAGKEQISRKAFLFISMASVFLIFLTILGQPFEPTGFAAADGLGLNPALKNFWMMIHPPVVFMGYAAATIPFAIALAQYDIKSGERPLEGFEKLYMEICWLFLSLGIVIGGLWAYEALGWGGYWAWDPVETASLIPWLVCTAYFHAGVIRSIISKSRELAAFATFLLVIFATFVTRGGAIVSPLHGYAALPSVTDVGWALIIFMIGITALTFFTLFGHREKSSSTNEERETGARKKGPLLERLLTSRNLHLVLYLVLFMLAVICFIGIVRNQPIDYFNTYCYPLVIAFVLGTMACTLIERIDVKTITYGLVAALLLGAIFSAALPITRNNYIDFGVGVILVSFIGVVYVVYRDLTSRGKFDVKLIKFSRKLIHISILVILLGVLMSATMKEDYNVYLTPGEGWPYSGTLPGDITLTIESIDVKNQVGWVPESWTMGPHNFTWYSPEFYEATITIQVSQAGKALGTGVLSCMNSANWGWFSSVSIQRTLALDVYIVAEQFGLNFTDPTHVYFVALRVTLHNYVNIVWIGAVMLAVTIMPSIWVGARRIRRESLRKIEQR